MHLTDTAVMSRVTKLVSSFIRISLELTGLNPSRSQKKEPGGHGRVAAV